MTKLFVKALGVAFALTVIYSTIPFQAACGEIPDEVFRLHIVANSDSDEDQQVKLRIRDKVLEAAGELFEFAGSKEYAEKIAEENLDKFKEAAASVLNESGFSCGVKAELAKMYFPTRYYEDYTLPSGMYDALRLTIGEGKGHNWWCVMYPSLCVAPSNERDEEAKKVFSDSEYDLVKHEKQEYKFKIVEIYEKIVSFFR